MTASSRGCGRAAARLLNSSTARPRTSTTTRTHTPILLPSTTRFYAIAATSFKPLSGPSSHKPHLDNLPPVSPSPASKTYALATGIVLSRPPLLTPEQSPFEKSFFLYQKRLNERLALPFTQYFYFKKDTPAIAAWKKHVKERNGVAGRDVGGYEAYGEEGWNDEVLVGSDIAEPERVRQGLVKEAIGAEEVVGEEVQGIEVYPRETEADRKGDMRSLERRLAETLYLVVKGGKEGENAWGFPRGELGGREMLHTAAERILHQTAGKNMNTWIVGHVPIGFSTIEPSAKFSRKGEKVFFMKGRIMAGQVDLKGNEMGVTDWKWVTRGELQGLVTPRYFSQVRGMLADR
ncbi:50S ribosomal subunit L30 protein [Rutstroemia sp. NJR-2017a WRK4]|nr:50S ribosomal subunit L30 protein [Rutstroemia sp. NJR-2017a WRK4]